MMKRGISGQQFWGSWRCGGLGGREREREAVHSKDEGVE